MSKAVDLQTNTKIVPIKIQRHATEDEHHVSFHLSTCSLGAGRGGERRRKDDLLNDPNFSFSQIHDSEVTEEGRRGKEDAGINVSRMTCLHSLQDCSVQFYCSVAWCGLLLSHSLARWIVALVVVPGVLVAVAAVLRLLEKNHQKINNRK